MKHIKNKRGQSTVEYVLLVTAVVAVIIFMIAVPKSPFQQTMNDTLTNTIGEVGNMSDRLQNSEAATGVVGNGAPPYSIKVCPPGTGC